MFDMEDEIFGPCDHDCANCSGCDYVQDDDDDDDDDQESED